uniref:NAD(P)-binding domain-containing protein n=1 Tax=Microvirga sp. G4-2 TaxID=3434467 RepID=UPI0040450BA7
MPADHVAFEPYTMGAAQLLERFKARQATLGIIGLGYVGLPLALTATRVGFNVLGFDINGSYVERLNRGESYIKHIPSKLIAAAVEEKRLA